MKKALNLLTTIVLIISCLGIGYLLSPHEEVRPDVQMIQMPLAREDHNTVRVLSSIPYGNDKRQSLDVYLPRGKDNFPVMFFIYGGAWSAGNKEMYGSVGYFYAKNGYATVIADHRLSPEVIHPAHIEDVARAFAWTKNNIAVHGGNPGKIYVCGHSSGAHLVSLLATNTKYLTKEGADRTDIKGVVAISGIYSLGANINFAGYGHIFPTKEDKYDASPINFLEKGVPPFVVLYADNDMKTLGSQATRFHRALQVQGITSSLHCVKEKDHTTILLDCVTPDHSSKIVLDFMK